MRKDFTLKKKIVILNIGVTLVCLIVTVIYMAQLRLSWLRQDMEENLMSISKIVAQSPLVKLSLEEGEPKEELQEYIKNIVNISRNIDNIVIMDLNGITYANSHIEGEIKITKKTNIEEHAAKNNKDSIKDSIQSFGKLIVSFVTIKDKFFNSFNDTLHNFADNDTVLKFGPFIATFVIILFNTLSTTKLLLSTSL